MPSVNGRKCSKLARRREMMSESASEMPQKSKEKRMSSPRYARARATRSSAFGSARSTVFGMGAVDKRCDEANGEEAQQDILAHEPPRTAGASLEKPIFPFTPGSLPVGESSSVPDNLALEGG